jgi:hypothetical protein
VPGLPTVAPIPALPHDDPLVWAARRRTVEIEQLEQQISPPPDVAASRIARFWHQFWVSIRERMGAANSRLRTFIEGVIGISSIESNTTIDLGTL